MSNLQNLIKAAGGLIGALIPILIAVALLVFLWGLVRFFLKSGDKNAVEEGRSIMVWGILALFVMVSVWGLVRFVGDALKIDEGGSL